MSSTSIGSRRPHVSAAADGALLTAGTFALFIGVQGLLVWLHVAEPAGGGSGPFLAQALGAIVVLIGQGLTMMMPVVVWVVAHDHPLSSRTVLALLGGLLGSALGAGLVTMALPLVGGFITPLAGGEIAALITMGAAIGIVFAAGALFALVDATQDLAPTRQVHRWLDIARIAAAVVLVLFSIGVVIGMQVSPAGEIGEAFAFVLLAAVVGALFVAATDVSDTWLRRHPRGGNAVASV